MTLYKNVDLEDLKSIMKKGILPISKTGNNWGAGKRAPNSTDVSLPLCRHWRSTILSRNTVWLFSKSKSKLPKTNSSKATSTKASTANTPQPKFKPEQIKNIYIPSMYENREDLEQFISGLNVTFVEIEGTVTVGTETNEITEETKTMFAQRTSINTADYNFLFCWDDNKKMNSIENVNYKF